MVGRLDEGVHDPVGRGPSLGAAHTKDRAIDFERIHVGHDLLAVHETEMRSVRSVLSHLLPCGGDVEIT